MDKHKDTSHFKLHSQSKCSLYKKYDKGNILKGSISNQSKATKPYFPFATIAFDYDFLKKSLNKILKSIAFFQTYLK